MKNKKKTRVAVRGELWECRSGSSAFTLIELLVATAILLIIVAIVSQVFQQANVAWSTGLRSVENTMNGRSVANLIAEDLSQAVNTEDLTFSLTAGGADFWRLGNASSSNNNKALWNVTYSWGGGTVTRSGVEVAKNIDAVEVDSVGGSFPEYVTVRVTVSSNAFETRAYMQNRGRYSY